MSAAYIRLIVTLVDDRQPGYSRHAHAVARLCRMVGLRLEFDDAVLESLHLAALLHDAGMLRLPFPHLGSRWDLPTEERRVWETHPEHGARMIQMLGLPAESALAVLGHHERWDGSGYPGGHAGVQIPLSARILGVCDVVGGACGGIRSAGGSCFSQEEALELLRDEEASRFDQAVVRVLCEALEDEREIRVLTGVFA
ncbi:MAG: HD domain-containing protein [Coriobacteriia bacterium]|nr:HD domain-containing protein [Coriobacteriia bacterium]MBN2839879.1 HD domain-containing protein [Coriobacteriia bacterium]